MDESALVVAFIQIMASAAAVVAVLFGGDVCATNGDTIGVSNEMLIIETIVKPMETCI